MTRAVEDLAARIVRLEKAVKRRGPQLAFSSIEDGAVQEYDAAGALVGRTGKQYDGTHTSVSLGGPTPPTPSGVSTLPAFGGLVVRWAGIWAEGPYVVAPMDFARVEVHVSPDPGFLGVEFESLRGTIESARGGEVVVSGLDAYTDYWVRTVTRTASGRFGVASPAAGPYRVRQITAEELDLDLGLLGGTTIFYGPDQPNTDRIGNLWYRVNPDGQYETLRWDGDSWELLLDQAATQAIADALAAQQAADDAAAVAAGRLQQFTQPAPPTGLGATDRAVWIDTDNGNAAASWSGTAWVPRTLGTGAITPQSLIASSVVATGTITAALLEAVLVLTTTVIAGDPDGAHARMTPAGFSVWAENPIDGTPYQVVRMGTATDDYFAITGADGRQRAAIDQTGKILARVLASAEWPTVAAADWTGQGGRLDLILDRRPRGLVSWGGQYTNAASTSNSTAGVGVYEIYARIEPGRMYKLHTSPLRVSGSVAGDLCEVQIRATSATGAPAIPTISSTVLARAHVAVARVEANSVSITKLLGPPSVAQGPLNMRLLLTYSRAAGTGNVLINGNSPEVIEMWLEDIGPYLPNRQQASTGGGGTDVANPPAATERLLQVSSTWVESYKADGSYRANDFAWQGYGDSFNGMQRSFIGFPDITGTLAGSTITEVAVRLYSEYWWANAGGTAVIGQHGYASPPGSLGPNRTENMVQSGGWGRGEGRWVVIPPTNWNYWLTGQYRGVMLGSAGMGNNTEYYGRFRGGADAILSIKYVK